MFFSTLQHDRYLKPRRSHIRYIAFFSRTLLNRLLHSVLSAFSMKVKNPLGLVLSLYILFSSITTGAAEVDAPSSEPPQSWYQVELYIFRQPATPVTELWPKKDDVSFLSEFAFMTIDPVPMANQLIAFQQLPQEWLQTQNIRSALRNSNQYRMLYEAAWRQPISSADSAKTIYVSGGKRQANYSELEGTIRLHKSRYLHIDAHLILGRYEEQLLPIELGDDDQPGSGDITARTGNRLDFPAETSTPVDLSLTTEQEYRIVPVETYELKQSRRMRSGELHYLDHPKLGVLIEVHRVKS